MNPETNTAKLIPLKDVALQLNLSVRAVYRLMAEGILPQPVKVRGASRLFQSDLDEFFQSLRERRVCPRHKIVRFPKKMTV